MDKQNKNRLNNMFIPKDRHLDMSVEASDKREAKRIADMAKPKKLTEQEQVKKEIMLAANKKAMSCGNIDKYWDEDFLIDYALQYGIDKMLALNFEEAEPDMLCINIHNPIHKCPLCDNKRTINAWGTPYGDMLIQTKPSTSEWVIVDASDFDIACPECQHYLVVVATKEIK